MAGPLDGIRVIDLTQFQQGPYGTVLLADFGADVIKIEPPVTGEPGRGITRQPNGASPYFQSHDRNKRSVTVDLQRPAGRQIIERLVEGADVFYQNFRPGVIDRLGLGYERLSAINPRLVYASASAFGSRGPLADRPGYDIVGQALSGFMAATGELDGPPGSAGSAVGDQTGGMLGALGVMMALFEREHTGQGQHVEVSLLGTLMALQTFELTTHLYTGQPVARSAGGHPWAKGLYGRYPARDGYFVMAPLFDKDWRAICTEFSLDHLVDDARFAEAAARVAHNDELRPILEDLFGQLPRDEILERLTKADVVCAPVLDGAEAVQHPQVLANEYVVPLTDPLAGPVSVVGNPIHLSRTPARPPSPAPELGDSTEIVLLEHGYNWDEISALRDEGVI